MLLVVQFKVTSAPAFAIGKFLSTVIIILVKTWQPLVPVTSNEYIVVTVGLIVIVGVKTSGNPELPAMNQIWLLPEIVDNTAVVLLQFRLLLLDTIGINWVVLSTVTTFESVAVQPFGIVMVTV